jgi:hypothetical protein
MLPFPEQPPHLQSSLLLSDELGNDENPDAGSSPRGSYNPMQFVLRLHKDVKDALDSETLTYRKVQAFSTYLHENIHWWQHVGSHLGFIISINYPAVAHAAHRDLSKLLANGEKYKPIATYDHLLGDGGTHQHSNQLVNILLNNWYDTYYAKLFIWDNKEVNAIAQDRRFFLSVGHSFHILWLTSLTTLAATVDPDFAFLPNAPQWHEEFKRLEQQRAIGFVADAGFTISPLGTKALFEGQARFNQLQYLAIALDNRFSYTDFEAERMLDGIYVEAFNIFLKITSIPRPDNLNNSVVGLFLLLCDIAINPTDGFPVDVPFFDTFIVSNDPGLRFKMLCNAVAENSSRWLARIVRYSAEEYRQLSEELSQKIVCLPPLRGSEVVAGWAVQHESVRQLMREEQEMNFSPHNLSIRLFFSKYIRFQQDKAKYPNVFCWPGKSMTSEASSELTPELVKHLFDKHRALFIEHGDGEIRPILFDGYPEENIREAFNAFYESNVSYDMIAKWLHEDGPFSYEYDWLTSKLDKAQLKDWVRNSFKIQFGLYPEDLTVL